jgi:hypothetical protein
MCILVFLCPAAAPLASGQTGQSREIPEGYMIIDGDILMPISLVEALRQRPPNSPEATIQTNFWPSGIVPFEFDGNVTTTNQTAMINAMAVLEGVANVDFQQCAGNNCSGNYAHVQSSTVNSSPVGMSGGQQVINIVSWGTQFIIVHELLHCLGFWHEHQRPDRDNFVQINCGNVQGGCNGSTFSVNFPIVSAATAYGYYDFDSVMHYGQCTFAANTCPPNVTITVLPPNNAQWQGAIGQRTHLSALDQATVSFIYPYADWRFLDTSYNGSNGSPNGSFLRPYVTFAQAMTNTPVGGTIWLLRTQNIPAVGIHNKQITIRAAPGVIGTLGS